MFVQSARNNSPQHCALHSSSPPHTHTHPHKQTHTRAMQTKQVLHGLRSFVRNCSVRQLRFVPWSVGVVSFTSLLVDNVAVPSGNGDAIATNGHRLPHTAMTSYKCGACGNKRWLHPHPNATVDTICRRIACMETTAGRQR